MIVEISMIKSYSKKDNLLLLKQYLALFNKQWSVDYSFYDAQYQLDLFHYEKQLLSLFGLPLNPDLYLFLFNMTSICRHDEHDAQWLYRQLSLKAEAYFSEEQQNDRQLLYSAKADKKDPFEILPALDVPINSYTIFLYDEIVLKNRGKDQEMLREFQLLKKNNLISEIYMLCFDANYQCNTLYHQLISIGLKHLPYYLSWYHNHRN